ncbi:No apical meristem (NAM) protein [Corchorus capsularis]|uniref:No apical meristem (NAM) protein n=1 Tax=Corchorus capsularis TaxID=210143 RepID=A0A1R3FUV9_COCAP|nr:No apical meristem (NAM) protein [Corchorus capsularis]
MEVVRSKFCRAPKYLTYRKDDDPKGLSGWVMHEYLADQGLNDNTTVAICKIQFKASSAKINNNNKRQDAMLEKEKENPSFPQPNVEVEETQEDCFGQLVADTNPIEEALGTSQTIDIDYDGFALVVIEPLDNLGSDQCNGVS